MTNHDATTTPCARLDYGYDDGGDYWAVRVWPSGERGPSRAWRIRDHVVAQEALETWLRMQQFPHLIEPTEELLRDWSIDKGEVA